MRILYATLVAALVACLTSSCSSENGLDAPPESADVLQTAVTAMTTGETTEISVPTQATQESTVENTHPTLVATTATTTTSVTTTKTTTKKATYTTSMSHDPTPEATAPPTGTTPPPTETPTVTTTSRPQILDHASAVILSQAGSLRDPCVLKANGLYYLFGTGWQGYCSVGATLDGYWATLGYCVEVPADSAGDHWAPEVYEYEGAYYMFTTYRSKETGRRGCAIFRSDKPGGLYTLHSAGHVTPKEWDSIDGSLYIDENEQPWMVFVHEWVSTDDGVGRIACAKLSKDLKTFISEPVELFRADDAPWTASVVTDGCWIHRCQDGSLIMLWSSFDLNGYCIGMAKSPSGEITGPWIHLDDRLFSKKSLLVYDGGHGMLFTDYEDRLWLALHSPNNASAGRPEKALFVPIKEENGRLIWDLVQR